MDNATEREKMDRIKDRPPHVAISRHPMTLRRRDRSLNYEEIDCDDILGVDDEYTQALEPLSVPYPESPEPELGFQPITFELDAISAPETIQEVHRCQPDPINRTPPPTAQILMPHAEDVRIIKLEPI